MSEVLQIKYIGIDDWNRPIFKPLDKSKKYYLSDLGNLFDYNTSEEQIKDFYKDMPLPLNQYITLHGKSIDTDPYGVEIKYELEIA